MQPWPASRALGVSVSLSMPPIVWPTWIVTQEARAGPLFPEWGAWPHEARTVAALHSGAVRSGLPGQRPYAAGLSERITVLFCASFRRESFFVSLHMPARPTSMVLFPTHCWQRESSKLRTMATLCVGIDATVVPKLAELVWIRPTALL